jgi:hypothetical protein
MGTSSKVCALALCSLAIAAPAAQAATQGSLTTGNSTGSMTVTANGPATARQVQVTGITDPVVNNSTRSEFDANNPGTTVTFCVVDTYAGSLALAANTGSLTSGGWALDGGGSIVAFRIAFTKLDNTLIAETPTNSISSGFFGLPAGVSVTSSGACGSGNLKAHVYLPNGTMPETLPARTYTATVQLVLSPQ